MAGIKRKQIPASTHQNGSTKKQKSAPISAPPVLEVKRPASDLEAETDSDPIVESDTTENSGDDDGVSWPSDDQATDNNEHHHARIDPDPPVHQQPLKSTQPKASAGNAEHHSANSKEAHAKQKVLAQERKAAKPNADSIARAKKLWERLRRKSHVPLDERKKLVAELFNIITGHVQDFVFKHDSVRTIQTAIKYANVEQRRIIARELKGHYRTLAESRYAKFLLGKLLIHGDVEIRDLVVPELYGHVRRLIKHPEASWILDDIYRGVATPSQKAILLREWYGAEFAIFKTEGKGPFSGDLKHILKEHPEKRKPVMHALHELINLLVQKKTTGFTMLHDAMLQYFLNIPSSGTEMVEFIEILKGDEEGDLLKNLAFTKSGAHLICLALAYGTAKDRKQMLRVYKNTIISLAYDAHGHQVLLAAYDVIDDTVLTSKSIFPELIGKSVDLGTDQTQALLDAVVHLKARVPLLYPFSGISKSILPAEDIDLLETVHAIRTTTSKKDPSVRRQELLSHLSPSLLSLITHNAEVLVQSSFGCQFITEVLLKGTGDRKPACKSIVALVQSDSPDIRKAIETPGAGRMLKNLVQGGLYNAKTRTVEVSEPPLGFNGMVFESLSVEDQMIDWATGGNSFVVVALWEVEGAEYRESMEKILKKGKQRLKIAAGDKEPAKGNRGSKLLLEMIGKT
ncbi:MAG: hypothetical protein Q9220_001217 [cf. Caloplaca sp. 1 TL-2023]